jgi:glucosamine 6-phosphate synthetase-like amidotransferase/phosphosugar isomerase protein
MCGIAGYVGTSKEGQWGETYVVLRELFLASEHRGRDATGFAALAEPLDRPSRRTVVVGKEPVTSSRFVNTNEDWLGLSRRRSSAVIQHVRAATHGDARTGDNRNNHPFASGSGTLQLVHNGVVGNHADLFDQFSLRPRTECDSEVLLRVAEQAKQPSDGLATCLREVRGSMAVAALDARRGVVYLATNGGRPLWVCRLRDGRRTFFASTASILLAALEKVLGRDRGWLGSMHPVAPGYVHALTPDGRLVALTTQPARYLDAEG